jgi:hypothetical protein
MLIDVRGALRTPLLAAVAVGVAAVVGCQSAPPPAQMAKTSLGTAPADLQLLCSNAVQVANSVDAASVLPVSSSQLDASDYEVILAVGAQRHRCVVNNDGVVKSVTPA